VVDDDPEFRELAGRLLAASGLTVVGEAGSVAAALAAAERLKPSAALVDVELPDGDGVTLARELAAVQRCAAPLDGFQLLGAYPDVEL
jgi:two-component system nitrate/nitrite response regulator NarL